MKTIFFLINIAHWNGKIIQKYRSRSVMQNKNENKKQIVKRFHYKFFRHRKFNEILKHCSKREDISFLWQILSVEKVFPNDFPGVFSLEFPFSWSHTNQTARIKLEHCKNFRSSQNTFGFIIHTCVHMFADCHSWSQPYFMFADRDFPPPHPCCIHPDPPERPLQLPDKLKLIMDKNHLKTFLSEHKFN